jgi:RNAse (barnase) inhibitor barstar
MPAETPQGRTAGAGTVSVLLFALLSDEDAVVEDLVLSDLGVGVDDLDALWDGVREEMAERTVGPEIDLGEFDRQMTVPDAARATASLLTRAGDRDDGEQR